MNILNTVKSIGSVVGSTIKTVGKAAEAVSGTTVKVTKSIDTFLSYSVLITPSGNGQNGDPKAFFEAARGINYLAYGSALAAKELSKMTVKIGDSVIKYSDYKAASQKAEKIAIQKATEMAFAYGASATAA